MKQSRFAAMLGSMALFSAIGDIVAKQYHGAIIGAIAGVLLMSAMWIACDEKPRDPEPTSEGDQ